jgi:hypothetical protein
MEPVQEPERAKGASINPAAGSLQVAKQWPDARRSGWEIAIDIALRGRGGFETRPYDPYVSTQGRLTTPL